MLLVRNRGRSRRLALLVGLLSMVTAFAVAAPALATDHSYTCEGCANINGPNDYIDEVGGTDYTYKIIDVLEWKFNGGSSWNVVLEAFSEKLNHVKVCSGSNEVYGHGETGSTGFYVHLSGREANYKNCSIP
jgi:glucose dehydrogenase